MTLSSTERQPGSGLLLWWPAAWMGSRLSGPPGTHQSCGHGLPAGGGVRYPRTSRTGSQALSPQPGKDLPDRPLCTVPVRSDRFQSPGEDTNVVEYGGTVQAW
jgi:hypothetical protein